MKVELAVSDEACEDQRRVRSTDKVQNMKTAISDFQRGPGRWTSEERVFLSICARLHRNNFSPRRECRASPK